MPFHPGLLAGSLGPSAAFEDAWPSRSSQRDLLLGVAPHLVLGGQAGHELAKPGGELVGEVRGRGTGEGIHIVTSRLGSHRPEPSEPGTAKPRSPWRRGWFEPHPTRSWTIRM